MSALRKNVTGQVLPAFTMLSLLGIATAGLTVAGYVVKDSGAQAACAGTFVDKGNGQYTYAPTQAETNANAVGFQFYATSMIAVSLLCFPSAGDPTDAVRGGLSALPNAAAEAAGGLYTRGSGAGQINQAANGQIDVNVVKVSGTAQTAGDLFALLTTVASYIDTEVAAIKTKTDNLPSDPASAATLATAFGTVNATLATIAGYIDTEVAAIKAKTDNLPGDPADASDIATSFSSVTTLLNTIIGYIDTEVAAIKAKTDNLPSDPADASDITSSFSSIASTLTSIVNLINALDVGSAPTVEEIGAFLSAEHGSGDWGPDSATDRVTHTHTVTNSVTHEPEADVEVCVYTDAALTNLIRRDYTGDFGTVDFRLSRGIYRFTETKSGLTFRKSVEVLVS